MPVRLFACVIGILVMLGGCSSPPSPENPSSVPPPSLAAQVPEPEPSSSPTAEAFEIIESGFGSDGEYVWVVAMVENRNPEVGQAVTVSFNLVGADDSIIASGTQLDAVTVKGATMIVGTQLEVPEGSSLDGASLETELLVEDTGVFTKTPFPAMTVGKVELIKKYGRWEAAFTITNESTEAVRDPHVAVACRNVERKIIGGGVDFSPVLAPKGRFRVSVSVSVPVLVSGEPSACEVAVGAPALWEGPADAPSVESTSQAHSDAAAAFRLWIDQFNDRDWKAQHATLVPEQRALISEAEFIACRDAGSNTFDWKRVVSAKDRPDSTIPGSDVKRAAVLLKVELVSNGSTVPVTIHMFMSPQGWQWSLTEDAVVDCQ